MGTIDFEYLHHGYIVFSLAVSMAYMMTQAVHTMADPLLVSREVLQGFIQKFPLSEDELDVLFLGVVARLSSSYVMSSCVTSEDKSTDQDYVTAQSRHCPVLLELLSSLGRDGVMEMWVKGLENGGDVGGHDLAEIQNNQQPMTNVF